jgi:alkanesulfonate monooxygenase SsuD/methylene tetrahydromethanopterin reductase-like flavin-dependent oxidoreductase (luciferase family)
MATGEAAGAADAGIAQVGLTVRDVSAADALALARQADGIDAVHSVWLPEGLGDRDSFAMAAAMTAATTRVKIATGVISLPMRSPATLTAAALTLDELSGGRFVLGVGCGNAVSLKRVGITDVARPVGVIREFAEYYRSVGDQSIVQAYDGGVHHLDALEYRPLETGGHRAPLAIAAHNPQMLRVAARTADYVLLNMQPRREVAKAVVFVEEHAQADRPIVACYVPTLLGAEDEALDGAKRLVASFCLSPVFRRRLHTAGSAYADQADAVAAAVKEGGPQAGRDGVSDEFAADVAIVGAAQLRPAVEELRRAGVDLPVLSVFPTPLDLKQFFPPLPASGMTAAAAQALNLVSETFKETP